MLNQEVILVTNETAKKRKGRLPPRLKEGVIAAIPTEQMNCPDINVIEYHVSKVLRNPNVDAGQLYQILDFYSVFDINDCMCTSWKLWPTALDSNKLYLYAFCEQLFEAWIYIVENFFLNREIVN